MKDNAKDSTRQKRILDICDKALDCNAAQRDVLLRKECGEDKSLRAEVDTMLRRIGEADEQDSGRTLSRDPLNFLSSKATSIKAGETVADFILLEEIGSGGMGAVFRAQRASANNEQQVAIKVLHAQIVTPELRVRFNIERDILSRLRHPYIAGLIDGGADASGRPYLAMELVDGIRIDQFCDQNKLRIGERIELLAKVGRALQHAHQNLVVHRDIKPSNVLVTPDGIPKLLDFGIAKLVTEGRASTEKRGATTYFGSQALTPDYASPEQLLEGKVSTASDTYSLGILATLLLTGRKPYEINFQSPKAVVKAFEQTGTWRASNLLSQLQNRDELEAIAKARRTTPTRLRKRFQGDLDTVLAKATHTEPERRYLTTEAFAQDLTNHRKGLPVLARGDSLAYRSWSLLRTNRLAFSVVGATIAALSIGLAAALWQAKIANDRFIDLHRFAQVVLNDVYDSVVELPGSTPTRKLIAEEAQHYLDKLAQDNISDETLLADLSLAYRRIGDVQGRPSSANLGESDKAFANYEKAREIAEQIETETPEMIRARAQVYRRQGELLAWQGQIDEAIEALQSSKAMLARLFSQDPTNASGRVDLAYNLINLGDRAGHPAFQNLGNKALAAQYYAEAIDLLQPAAEVSDDRELLRCYSVAFERAGTLAAEANDLDAAQSHYERSRVIRSQLARAHPDHMNIQRDAGIAIEKVAQLQLLTNKTPEAIDNFKAALGVYMRLSDIDPNNASASRTVAIGRENLGDALLKDNKKTEAMKEFSEASHLLKALLKNDPKAPRLTDRLAQVEAKLQQFSN